MVNNKYEISGLNMINAQRWKREGDLGKFGDRSCETSASNTPLTGAYANGTLVKCTGDVTGIGTDQIPHRIILAIIKDMEVTSAIKTDSKALVKN